MVRSFYLGIKYPSLLLSWLKRRDIGVEIKRKRTEEWAKLREYYRNHPKVIFGLKIYLNAEDFSPVSTSIATTGWLDLSLTGLLMKVLKPGMTVVDVGANIGYYTLLCAKIVGGRGLVYAFEPEPFNLKLLNKSVSANNLTNIKVYSQALWETEGVIKLHLADPREPQAHSIGRDWGRGTIDVISTTLDSFWEDLGKPHLDMLKIHVGGDDLVVLRGARRVIQELRPSIAAVFVPDTWRRDKELFDELFLLYDVYRVAKSPFLIRRVQERELLGNEPTELFLAPKPGGKR